MFAWIIIFFKAILFKQVEKVNYVLSKETFKVKSKTRPISEVFILFAFEKIFRVRLLDKLLIFWGKFSFFLSIKLYTSDKRTWSWTITIDFLFCSLFRHSPYVVFEQAPIKITELVILKTFWIFLMHNPL